MLRILLQNSSDHHVAYCDSNLGGAAVVQCTAEALRQVFPGAKIASLPQLTPAFTCRHNIRQVKSHIFTGRVFSIGESIRACGTFINAALWAFIRKYLKKDASFLVNCGLLKEYYDADLIVDISMDHLNDIFGIIPVLEHSRDILLGRLLGKPVVIYAQSIGPYNGKFSGWIAKQALNRVSLITVRERLSYQCLNDIGVKNPPIYVTADPAFLLTPAPDDRVQVIMSELGIDQSHPIVGMAVPEGPLLNAQKWRGYKRILRSAYHMLRFLLPESLFTVLEKLVQRGQYFSRLRTTGRKSTIDTIVKIIDFVTTEIGASVILIPHVLLPEGALRQESDARTTVIEAHELVATKSRVVPVVGKYTAEELKGIIGRCDILISFKMHAAIAGISQCIPTMVVGNHPKFRGIMQMLGQGRWAFDQTPEDLIARIDDAWIHKEEIRKELESRQEAIREETLLNAQLVKQLLDSTPE
jgi:polysaccharide pyruvyl transferase WcaK-like protein